MYTADHDIIWNACLQAFHTVIVNLHY